LPQQLREWGWRPPNLFITDQEIAALARQNLQQDPAAWGGSTLSPDTDLLLQALAGTSAVDPDARLVLDLTTEHTGLPTAPKDEDAQSWQRWRIACLARLLVTQAHSVSPKVVSGQHELLVEFDKRLQALQLLDRWIDSSTLSRNLPESIQRADTLTGLREMTHAGAGAGAGATKHGPFISYAAERALFSATCSRLSELLNKELLLAISKLGPDLERHAEGFWGERQSTPQGRAMPWRELLRLSRAATQLLDASPSRSWSAPKEAVEWYISTGWRVEQSGEQILRDLSNPTLELVNVITSLRAVYKARWEEYMRQWSDLWVASGCAVPPLPTAGEWLLESLKEKTPSAVIVIDALRYDLGASLVQMVNAVEEAERATVEPARAPLPSITALGMAANLPILENALQASIVDGKWQVKAAGSEENLSNAGQRRQWWQKKGGVRENGILSVQGVLSGLFPSPPECTLVVVYDDAIDKLGHDDELQAQGSEAVLARYLACVERLRDLGWKRICIVTDHGFIQWDGKEERSVPLPAAEPAYSSRRAAAYPAATPVAGPGGLAPGGLWRIAVPLGAAAFRTYGGHGYYHGGASLQEWIIPCVRIEWPSQARQVEIAIEPLSQILTRRPRVNLRVHRESMFVEDSMPRQVEVIIRGAAERTILFRGAAVRITPAQSEVAVTLEQVKGVEAERGTHLRIEVRDLSSEAVLDACDSTLKIELSGW
jgi:hypothetical protein